MFRYLLLTGLDTSAGEGTDGGSQLHSMYVHMCVCICICDIISIGEMVKVLEKHVSVPWFEHMADVTTEERISSSIQLRLSISPKCTQKRFLPK